MANRNSAVWTHGTIVAVSALLLFTFTARAAGGSRRAYLRLQPGAGAATFRKLAGAGVNADLLVPVRVSDDLFFAVICVDDPDKARRALGVQVISEGDFVL